MALVFYQKTTGTLQTIGLMNGANFANNATLEATLFDQAGKAVPGFMDVAGVYVLGSNGCYNFPVPALDLPAGGGYTAYVTATTPDGNTRTWYVDVIIVGS